MRENNKLKFEFQKEFPILLIAKKKINKYIHQTRHVEINCGKKNYHEINKEMKKHNHEMVNSNGCDYLHIFFSFSLFF